MFKYNDSPRERAQCVMQHILKLKRQNIGSQCKDVKVGVICEK